MTPTYDVNDSAVISTGQEYVGCLKATGENLPVSQLKQTLVALKHT